MKKENGPNYYCCEHKLGQVLKDKITGFTGVVMGITFYYTNCVHYGLCPVGERKNGKVNEWEWFDESRVVTAKIKGKSFFAREDHAPTSGPFQNAPEQ